MDKIIEKLDSYQILVNLLPGTFFCVALRMLFGMELPNENFVIDLVIYYFTGLFIGRISSIIIEPILERLKFIELAPHKDFIAAETIDTKIAVILAVSNFYRSLLTAILILPCVKVLKVLTEQFVWFSIHGFIFLLIFLFIVMLFSYQKQNNYVRSRVITANTKKGKTGNDDPNDDPNDVPSDVPADVPAESPEV